MTVPVQPLLSALLLSLALTACTAPAPPDRDGQVAPEAASAIVARTGRTFAHHAVAAAHPLAAEAAESMLRTGGSAVDAAIAAQMVLGLVEPQSSGVGGGAFLMHWDGQQVQAYDGRETAPAKATESLFLNDDGRPMAFMEAVVGGRAVGVPGVLRMLELAHQDHGRLPWARLFEPAIDLAERGFPISPRLHTLLLDDAALARDPTARAYFYAPDGQPWPVGHVLRNPELAAVLRDVAARGADAFYQGEVARAIVAKVRSHASNPGLLAAADLADYRARRRDPLCSDWKTYRVCGFPPPSSGQLAIMQILGLLEEAAPRLTQAGGSQSAAFLHTYLEASRLAFADRALYVADPDFAAAPGGDWHSLLNPDYLRERADLIGAQRRGDMPPGRPGGLTVSWAPQAEQPEHGTSHLSIVDDQGQAVAMTTTIESQFGARQMVRGFLLNNELTDFSLAPVDVHGHPIANRVQAGKRPRSSMSPTLVFDRAGGHLLMSLGSPGGAFIIHATAKTLLGTLAWGLSPQEAIDLPNIGTLGGPALIERGRLSAATRQALTGRGHTVEEVALTSGLQALLRTSGGWLGGTDPRREGVVLGN